METNKEKARGAYDRILAIQAELFSTEDIDVANYLLTRLEYYKQEIITTEDAEYIKKAEGVSFEKKDTRVPAFKRRKRICVCGIVSAVFVFAGGIFAVREIINSYVLTAQTVTPIETEDSASEPNPDDEKISTGISELTDAPVSTKGVTPTGTPVPTKGVTPTSTPAPTKGVTPTSTPAPTKGVTPTSTPVPTKAVIPTSTPVPTKPPTPIPDENESGIKTMGKCGDNCTWTLDYSGKLTISGKGTVSSHPWDSNKLAVKEVIISEGITELGISSFHDYYDNLEKVSFPSTLQKIETYAFPKCTALTTITIPESVTYIGYYAFADCSNLSTVYFEGDAPKIEAYAFGSDHIKVYYHMNRDGWLDATSNNYGAITIDWNNLD